jgi:cytochrome c-type biogenesis protein CcsB
MIFTEKSSYTQTGLIGFSLTVGCLTVHLILRWFDSGHFPLSNLYESLLFLSWCLLILHIYIENSAKTLFLGVLTSPAILCLIAFTDFSLPPELQRSGPLVPALQSNWLVMHVTVMIASYAALLLGCLVAIAYLIFSQFFTNQTAPLVLENQVLGSETIVKQKYLGSLNSPTTNASNQESYGFDSENAQLILSKPEKLEKIRKVLLFLDNLSYRTIGIGFCFLTLGILSGAVWANETWGNYWSWDPKETWAFITWLTFACYLHSRLVGGWSGSKPAWIAGFGFIIVWVCYLGVNLLGQGLHSYGFLQL